MKDIQQVKQEHELEWMKVPGVEGVGISQDGDHPLIVLYVTEKTPQVLAIGDEIDGYAITLRQSGEFIAF